MDILQALINAAQVFIDTGFSTDEFLLWQQLAFLTILALLGPFHFYTRNFGRFTENHSREGLLAGEGILEAAKEELARGGAVPSSGGKIGPPTQPAPFIPWLSRHKRWCSLEVLKEDLR